MVLLLGIKPTLTTLLRFTYQYHFKYSHVTSTIITRIILSSRSNALCAGHM